MLRKIATILNLLAMLMVLFTTVVPHHHHQAMICLIREVCVADDCCNDEHTMHADTDRENHETHCVAHVVLEAVKEAEHSEPVLCCQFPFRCPGLVHQALEFLVVLL